MVITPECDTFFFFKGFSYFQGINIMFKMYSFLSIYLLTLINFWFFDVIKFTSPSGSAYKSHHRFIGIEFISKILIKLYCIPYVF